MKTCSICGAPAAVRDLCAACAAKTTALPTLTPGQIAQLRREQRDYERAENAAERQSEYYAERAYYRRGGA